MASNKRVSLHLLRHADAGDPGGWTGDDAARPLSEKGIRQAERLGAHLARAGFEPDLILTSPKLRATQTAKIVADALGKAVVIDDRLGDALDLETLAEVLGDHGSAGQPVLVGHDPDFSDLVTEIVGAEIPMKKGAIARIDLPNGLESGEGTLRWLLPPDLVPRS